MTPRPAIFISATTHELKSARQLVANTLIALGYEPHWQDIFGTEQGDLRAMLQRQIKACEGLVQLVGQSYGAEPSVPDERHGRVSYTQYEALYAREIGKKVWYLLLEDSFPADPCNPESDELRDLQRSYRQRIEGERNLRYRVKNDDSLALKVHQLRDELVLLRKRARQLVLFALLLLVLAVAGIGWLWHGQQKSDAAASDNAKLIRDEVAAIREAFLSYPSVRAQVANNHPGQSAQEIENRTYQRLADQVGGDAGALREKLPARARELRESPNSTPYERAIAAFVTKDYAAAEQLAREAAEAAGKSIPPRTREQIEALELAGNSAREALRFGDALAHFEASAALVDRTRDPMGWARQQFNIALTLQAQGKHPAAEALYRKILEEYLRVLGPDDTDTLTVRSNLAEALREQQKNVEAETEHRAVLKSRESILGPAHADTLSSRNNLALSIQNQGRYAEAEKEHRAVLDLRLQHLGPDHADTLKSRNNLANALVSLGRLDEAERELLAVVESMKRTLPPKHPDLLSSRSNLANVWYAQTKYGQAESEYRAILEVRRQVLGEKHVDTIMNRNNLAAALAGQGKYAEAVQEHREVLKLREEVLTAGHPDIFQSCFNLALCLTKQNETLEALSFAKRAETGFRSLPGTDPEALRNAEKLRKILESTQEAR